MTARQEPDGSEYLGSILLLFKEHSDFFRLVGGIPALDVRKLLEKPKEKAAQKEINALLGWFAGYNCRIMQCLRARRMSEGICGDIAALDSQVKEKLARLQTLLGKRRTP